MESKDQYEREPENHFLRIFCVVVVLLVVLVHYWPKIDVCGYDLVAAIQSVGRFAMPVFFMISGYFLFSKDGHSEKRLGKKALRIFLLIVFIKFFYLFLDVILASFGFIGWNGILYDFLVFGDSTSHYWFVAALLTAYLLHWIFYHFKVDFKFIIPISLLFLVIDLVFCELLPMLGVNEFIGLKVGDISAGTYVLICLFFFQAGYYVHKHKEKIDARFSNLTLILLMVFSMALHIVETFFSTKQGVFDGTATVSPNLTIGTIIFSFAVFVASFRLGEHFRCRPMEWLGRNTLPWLYAFATFGSYTLKLTLFDNYKNDFFIYDIVGPIASIIVDIVAALLMYFILWMIFEKPKRDAKKQTSAQS